MGCNDKRGRTLFVNFWLKNKETSDTIQVRGDKSGDKRGRTLFVNFCPFVPHSALFGEPVWRKWCNDKFSKQPIQMRRIYENSNL